MDPSHFDRLTRLAGSGRSRRAILKTLAGGALAAAATAVGLGNAAARTRSVGNSCTTNADCASGLCASEAATRKICHCRTASDCPAATAICHAAVCLPSGYCGTAITAGASCDDGTVCTSNDVCQPDGQCAGTAITCPGADQCHTMSCDPLTGCRTSVTAGAACDDANACTTNDICQASGVCSGTAIVCPGVDQCHTPFCDPDSGCGLTVNTGMGCDDGNPDTINDVCQADGSCKGTLNIGANCDGGSCQSNATIQPGGACLGTPLTGGACGDGGVCDNGQCFLAVPNCANCVDYFASAFDFSAQICILDINTVCSGSSCATSAGCPSGQWCANIGDCPGHCVTGCLA